jgi:hypothetical protein
LSLCRKLVFKGKLRVVERRFFQEFLYGIFSGHQSQTILQMPMSKRKRSNSQKLSYLKSLTFIDVAVILLIKEKAFV